MAEFGNQYIPKVFISYSWKSEEYKERVLRLATRLMEDGVDVILDRWDLKEGQSLSSFMEKSIKCSERVLILCEESYAGKADDNKGGVGTETLIIRPEVYEKADQQKFIPVIMELPARVPDYLKDRLAINNACKDGDSESGYNDILRTAYGVGGVKKPQRGKTPKHIADMLSGGTKKYDGESGPTVSEQGISDSIPLEKPAIGKTPKRVQQALDKGPSKQKPEPQQKSELQQNPENSIQKKKPYSGMVGVGRTIAFGRYPYGTDGKKEVLKWRILAVEKDRVLIITDQLIDCAPYNKEWEDVTWETCSLRKWMNEDFIREAFNEEERSGIIRVTNRNPDNRYYKTKGGEDTPDRVFALSIEEANKYFNKDKDRMAAVTPYAEKQGSFIDDDHKVDGRGTGWWWLRSPGYYCGDAANVYIVGGVSGRGDIVANTGGSVRPALWLNL